MPEPGPPLASTRIVVFDTETTGLTPGSDHVIEIAALALEGGAETERFESLIDPGVPIPPELIAIHGITDRMVRGQPGFAEVARRFLDFAGDSILAAHNAPYDIAMLLAPLRDAGLGLPGNPVIDTCRLARRTVEAPNYQLSTVADALGIEMSGAHRAMPDVEACASVLKKTLSRVGEAPTLADVERVSATRLEFGSGEGRLGPLPERLAPIKEALRARRPVEIAYRGGSHGDRPRAITPLFLLELDGSLCVAALCHIDNTLKNFRASLIAGATPLRS